MTLKFTSVKKYFFRFWNAGFFLPNILIPLAVLTLYFVVLTKVLPDGVVNQAFASRGWKHAAVLTAGLYAAFFAIFKFKKGRTIMLKSSVRQMFRSDLILLLLPLTPVVQYILNNQDILSLRESFYIFGLFALLSAVFIFAVPLVFSIFGSLRTLMFLGFSFVFTLTNMALFSSQFSWFGKGNFGIQAAVFLVIFFAGLTLDHLKQRKLLYLVLVVYFLANSVSQIFAVRNADIDGYVPAPAEEQDSVLKEDNPLVKLVGDKEPVSTPNIYLLIYDAYQANEVMLSLGIDNSAQEKYLGGLGFKLYPKTYSIGSSSLGTMGRVLNASPDLYGTRRRAVSGDGVVQNLLKGFGYETYGLFRTDYFFRGTESIYDVSFPDSSPSAGLLISAILNGEFRFDLEGKDKSPAKFIASKLAAFDSVSGMPRFIYTHTDLPGHSQLSGACLPNETARYQERLGYANTEMKKDLETLIENDPNAIIIVASDHGSYLTKNCGPTERANIDVSEINRFDIQSRFGTFLAVRWPGKDFEKYGDITVLQDLFPSIFAYMYRDEKFLQAKVEPDTVENNFISGASVENGIIHGGINDGEPLFISK
ncbi:MAG: hypothetical protein WD897_00760 [Parcubacteria group bacterium]